METPPSESSGLLGSLRSFADGLLGSLHSRIELLSLELQEEKFRLIQVFIWISAMVFLAILATVFASLVLVAMFWETARVTVMCSLAGAYLVGLIAVLVGFRRFLAQQPKPFAATLTELKKDRECFRTNN
jgi:uncharacterized membrane protein YqjE